jgi:integrase
MPVSDDEAISGLVSRLNRDLATRGIALKVERRGQRLGLRGPLPCRRGSGSRPFQRLSLGLPATPEGVEQALALLEEIHGQLARGRFRWEEWGPRRTGGQPCASPRDRPRGVRGSSGTGGPGSGAAVARRLREFETAFFEEPRRRRRPAGSRTTWRAAYQPYLRRLLALCGNGAGRDLDATLLAEVLESYGLATRSRQQCGIALAALARHLAIALPADWRERSGGYGLHAARFRQLPSDQTILALLERIPNPRWRLAYGLMATYGLRNHEVFFSDLSSLAPGGDRVLRVLPTSKTGEHQVWPFQPQWVEVFGLERLGVEPQALPRVTTDLRRTTLQQVGRRVAEQFRRYALPLTPYDLRHAWAVRTIHIGLPDSVAARMMGHSVGIHTRTYHHWITRRDQQQAVDAALARLTAGQEGQGCRGLERGPAE